MTIYDLYVWGIVALIAFAIWQHMNVSRLARQTAQSQCQKHQLLLLDQSVILRGIRLRFDKRRIFFLERNYAFEFSTQGDQRYRGELIFAGKRLIHSYLQAYKV